LSNRIGNGKSPTSRSPRKPARSWQTSSRPKALPRGCAPPCRLRSSSPLDCCQPTSASTWAWTGMAPSRCGQIGSGASSPAPIPVCPPASATHRHASSSPDLLIQVLVLAPDDFLIDLADRGGGDFVDHLELFRQLPFRE